MEEEISLKEKVDYLFEEKKQLERGKIKKFKIPKKGNPSKGKLKKGYTIVMRIDDNKNVDFEKQPIEDSTYKLKQGTYHSVEEQDILLYKGKPLVIQPSKKLNPYNPLSGTNQTYGQKYIMARMLKDTIKMKKNAGSIIIWILVIGAAIFGVNYLINK
jgi:hypothetical protein